MAAKGDFYCRYYVGHKGKFGHEFLEFEFTSDGQVCLCKLPKFMSSSSADEHMPMQQLFACRCGMPTTLITKMTL